MKRLLRAWRRLCGRCPNCGLNPKPYVRGMSPATACPCGWWAEYVMDGSRFEHFPASPSKDGGK